MDFVEEVNISVQLRDELVENAIGHGVDVVLALLEALV